MELDDLEKITDLFKTNIKTIINLKIAVIMTSPTNMVFPMLAQRNYPYKIKAFSTMEGAEKWLIGI